MSTKKISASIICALVISGVVGYFDYLQNRKLNFFFVVEMKTSTVGLSWVLFNTDTGQDYNEQDSVSLRVVPGVWEKYSFALPPTKIDSIRFDPISTEGVFKIREAGIENSLGDTVKKFPAQSFISGQHHQISRMDILEDSLIVRTTENANDPIIIIENSSFDMKSNWVEFFVQHAWVYAGYFLLGLIFFLGSAKYFAGKIPKIFNRLSIYAAQNPKISIAFIGLTAAIVSCYPVVFFGKSFVSTGVGMWGLYNAPPWFPGLPLDAIAENFRGSDTYAAAVSTFPNAAVQYESIFRDFEFPFWNRYLGGGGPLFAQAQSMIGDFLHWIPVSMKGSAIGWDIKIVLSKAFFSVGMGLLVYRLTDKLLAGLLIAVSSCFLGFFAWRFNHPAFFVLTYSPWVVLQWDRMGKVMASPNRLVKNCLCQGLLLTAVSWLQINAGAPKEGVITAVFMHALGVLAFVAHITPKWGMIRSLCFAGGIGVALIMITAPYWLLFLDALGKAYTVYNTPSVNTYPPWAMIGFFDNLFFERLFGSLWGPSTNLFVLFSMSVALLGFRVLQSWMVYSVWGLFTFAFCIAYSVIPHSILIAIPFINNIYHVGNTFSVPMMVLSLIIAGYGVRDYLAAPETQRRRVQIFSMLVFFGLWFVSIWQSPPISLAIPPISFVIEERYLLILSIIMLVFLSLSLNEKSVFRKTRYGIIILTVCFVALHIRHGLHLFTGVSVIDLFVTNPTPRPDFSETSSAIEYVKNKIDKAKEPTRVIGEWVVLFPGLNSRLSLEGLVSAEPIRSENFDNLLTLVDYPYRGGGWLHLIKSEQIASRAASLDLLGIGYIIADVAVEMPQGMKLVHSSDLAVWQRDSVWPRAFFVNTIVEVHEIADITGILMDKSNTPFAAVETQFIPKQYKDSSTFYQVVPASNYRLTNNSTSFSVDASGPGIIVLGETYYPGDFVVQVNGKKVDYIRVNAASKGIWVNKAGRHDVSFRYRPENLNLALAILASGLAFLILLIIIVVIRRKIIEAER